ncbi:MULTISPECIES: tape measure protein [unclassified Shinella]|uniref:tape measure protein n=1 Tax=unclassified Shinella TaxID=2643062 RepID=UPI00234EC999|nr:MULTISPECIES: tape measure protein [unclassified Shinella]MCO5152590.1 tape measure protein [Shinella sp.]MDC7261885.1 hypothetical protein [Shinella sp. HY16]MDC7268780.1 hypothetical protein [Shinella sp. YZ44]
MEPKALIIDELIAILGYDVRGEGELARFNRGVDLAEKNARRASHALNAMGVAVGTFVGNIAAMGVLRLGEMLGSLPGDVISTGRAFEKMQATLETIEGSADKAKASLDWVQEFAKTTPYDLTQVSEAFVRLRAYGLDPTTGVLEKVGNASSAMGKDLMSGVEAIADAAQGENERLKEFGIRASVEGKKITYSWQQNGQEMTKTVTKNGTEIVKALMEIFGRFDGAMQKQSGTLDGMLSNLGDSWTGFLKEISDRGIYEDVKSRVRSIMDSLANLEKDGSLDRWAESISKGMSRALDLAWRFAERVVRNVATLGELLDGFGGKVGDFLRSISGGKVDLGNWQALMVLLAGLLAYVRPVWFWFALAAIAVDDFLTYLRGGESYVGDFINALGEFLGADPAQVADVLGKIAGAAAGLFVAAIGIRVFAGAIRSLAGALGLMAAGKVAKGTAAIGAAGEAAAGKNGKGSRPGLGLANLFGLYNAWELIQGIPGTKEGVEEFFKSNKEQTDTWNKKFEGSPWLPRNWFKDGRNTAHPYAQPDDGGRAASLDAYLDFPANLQRNLAKLGDGRNAAAVTQPMTDNRDQSVSVGGVNVVVNGVANASAAVGAQVGASIGAAVGRAGGTRFEKDDKA